MTKKKTFLADTGLIYSAAIWGATFYLVKDSLGALNPVVLVGYRFLLASFIILPYLIIKRINIFYNIKSGLILGILLWLLYVPQTVGLKYTTASNSGFITGLFIVFVPIFSYLMFKEIPSFMKLISVILATIGLWILTGGLKEINIGDIFTLGAAMAYSLHLLFAGKIMKEKNNPYLLNFQQFFFVGIFSIIFSLVAKYPLSGLSSSSINVILFLAIFPTITAFVVQLEAQKFTSSLKVAVIFSLEPVFAAIFSWTLGGETFRISGILGGSFIVAAMILSEIKLEKIEKYYRNYRK